MTRRMTATIHISPEVKMAIDAIIPSKINKARVSYDEAFDAILMFFKDLGYDVKDITELVITYRQKNLEALVIN